LKISANNTNREYGNEEKNEKNRSIMKSSYMIEEHDYKFKEQIFNGRRYFIWTASKKKNLNVILMKSEWQKRKDGKSNMTLRRQY
jgi:hypothetical protein